MANFGKLLALRFRTLVWRPEDTVQNLGSPGLSGRVESPELLLLHNLQNIRMICEVKTTVSKKLKREESRDLVTVSPNTKR